MMTLEEYMRELILMEKQYGQEEELYPLINMLLRENDNVKHLSVRDVHNHASSHVTHDMLYGYASFPDFVIMDENCDLNSMGDLKNAIEKQAGKMYGCVEAKIFKNGEKNNKIFELKDKALKLQFECDDYIVVRKKGNGNKGYLWAKCVNKEGLTYKYIDMERSEIIKIIDENTCCGYSNGGKNNNKTNLEDDKSQQIRFGTDIICNKEIKDDKEVQSDQLTEINSPGITQLIGELLWYGKVLYTNGLKWEYLELKGPDKNEIRKDLVDCLVEKGSNWTRKIDKKECTMMCVEIGNLEGIYNELKNEPIDSIRKKVVLHAEGLRQWSLLKYNLACINWIGENTYDQFITKEDYEEYEKTNNPTP